MERSFSKGACRCGGRDRPRPIGREMATCLTVQASDSADAPAAQAGDQRGSAAAACRFVQEPAPALSLVDPNLDQTGRGDVAMVIADTVG